MAEQPDYAKLHAAAVAAHAALEEALGLEDQDQRRADAKAEKAANARVAKLERSAFRVPGTITTMGMPEMEWEDGTLPAETYKVGEDRVIHVHPAHEEMVRQHGAVRDHKGDAARAAAGDDGEDDKAARRPRKAHSSEQTFPDSESIGEYGVDSDAPRARITSLGNDEPVVAYSGDVNDEAYTFGPEHKSRAESGLAGTGGDNPESEQQAADARTYAVEHETKAERIAEDAETTSGPYSGQPNTANTQPSVEPGPEYAGSPELAGAPLSPREYGREPEATE